MSTTLTNSDRIHQTAVVSTEAALAPDVQVGPFAIIDGPAQIGPGCIIEGHACISGPVILGPESFVGHGALIGKHPDPRPEGDQNGRLVIGSGNVIREYVTIQRGRAGGETRIGDRNYIMINVSIGHDTVVGNSCTVVNGASIGNHVSLSDGCVLSAHSSIHDGVRVGRLAMIGGLGSTDKDVPPFVLVQSHNAISGLNLVGLRRAGIKASTVAALREVFRDLSRDRKRSTGSTIEQLRVSMLDVPEVLELLEFIESSQRGVNQVRGSERLQRTF